MFVCCECCVLSGRSLCHGLITRPEESYRLWRVVVCDLQTSKMRRLKPATVLWKYNQKEGKQTNHSGVYFEKLRKRPKTLKFSITWPKFEIRTFLIRSTV